MDKELNKEKRMKMRFSLSSDQPAWKYIGDQEKYDKDLIFGMEVHNIDTDKYPYFVYVLTNKEDGMKYIGQKKTYNQIKKKKKESNWRYYRGSSPAVHNVIYEKGTDIFEREIVTFCTSAVFANYKETELICETKALLKPEEYYNSFLFSGRINRSSLIIAMYENR